MLQELTDAFTDMRMEDALRITGETLDDGTDPMEVLNACQSAMEIIGQRFEAGEAFVPELIMAGEMMNQISEQVKPRIEGETQAERLGRVLLGTVEGDIHDIGKDIVAFMLDIHGFEVIDIGVDVPAHTFVDKIRESQPDVVGMSGLLTLAFDAMKRTMEAIETAGLREEVKIMIGGAPVDDHVQAYTGADAWGKDAMEAVSLARQWIGG